MLRKKKGDIERLIGKLAIWNPQNVRQEAVEALVTQANTQVITFLITILESWKIHLYRGVIATLVGIGEAAVEPLIKTFIENYFEFFPFGKNALGTINRLQETLIKIGSPAVKSLINELSSERSSHIKKEIVTILGKIGDPYAVPPLIEKLQQSDNLEIKQEIIAVLGQIGDSRAVSPLIEKLQQSDIPIVVVVKALGNIGDIGAIEPLTRLLEDERYTYYNADILARAFGKIGGASVVGPLISIIKDIRFPIACEEAITALSRIGDIRAAEPLIEALGRGFQNAEKALEQIGFQEVKPYLIKALIHEDARVRTKVVNILEKNHWETSNAAERTNYFIAKRTGWVWVVQFGGDLSTISDEKSTLVNPDVSELTIPITTLQSILIYTQNYDFHLIERFLMYAINYIGQKYLKKRVEVHIYGDPEELHPNLRNTLENLCKNIEIHETK